MHYEIAVSKQDLTEFSYNSKEMATNLWISQLPTYGESIGYEVRGHLLVVKFEENEDGRITYGNPSYSMATVSQTVALACAMHSVKSFQLGKSVYTIHVAVNEPSGKFFAKQDGHAQILTMHQVEGLVFVKEQNFYTAVDSATVATLYINRMGMSIDNLIPDCYLVRFEHNGKFHYFPLSYVFTDPVVRSSYLRKNKLDFDWVYKRLEIDTFVEEWTK